MFDALSDTGKKTVEKTSLERPASMHASRVLRSIATPVCRSVKGVAAKTICLISHVSVIKYSQSPRRETPRSDQMSPAIAGLMPALRNAVLASSRHFLPSCASPNT
eukprot:scaffold188410_cov33-Tisochrysis_lutea.AAC.1